MNLIFHQFKKDIRHYRLLVILWFLLIGLQAVLNIWDVDIARITDEYEETVLELLRLIFIISSFLRIITLIVLVSFVIHDEPLVGSTAFWFTRPISRKTLLASKTLLIFLLAVLLPFIAQILVLVYWDTNINHILLAIPGMLINEFLFVALLVLLASLTKKFMSFVLAGIVIPILYALFFIFIVFFIFKHPTTEIFFQPSGPIAGVIMSLTCGAGLIIHQYLTRKTPRTILLIVLTLLAIIPVRYIWRWESLERGLVLLHKVNPAIKISSNVDRSLAEAYRDRGLFYKKSGKYNITIEDGTKAIDIDPGYAEAYETRGNAYQNLKEYQKALKNYDKAIELDPKFNKAYNRRGIVYNDLGEFQMAMKDYDKAIEINRKYPEAYYNRGIAHDNLGQYQKALEDYTKAIELRPKYAWAYHNRGIIYKKLGQYDKALEDYNKVLKLNPEDACLYNDRGIAYKELGQYDKAIENYNKAIELDLNLSKAYYNRGIAYYKLAYHNREHMDKSKLDLAMSDFNKTLEINPGDAGAYYMRAIVYHDFSKFDKAIADYTKAIELDPDYGLYYYYRGKAYKQSGQIMKMVEDFTKVMEINPEEKYQLAYAMIELAMVAYEKGDYKRVKSLCNSMVEKCTLDETASNLPYEFRYVNDAEFLLGEIYKSEGNMEEAKRHYDRIQQITKEYDTVPVYTDNKWNDVPVEQILRERIK